MSRITFDFRNTLFFVSMFMFPLFSLANSFTGPENTADNFYKAYLNSDSVDNAALISKFVSNELMKSINDSIMCNYDSDDSVSATELEKICSQKNECKEYKSNYICDWYGIWVESDVNYFTKSQDVYPSWKSNIKTNVILKKGKESVVGVILGGGADPTKNLRVTLKQKNDGWRIVSVTE